jgi:putative intracellular protease/amidase
MPVPVGSNSKLVRFGFFFGISIEHFSEQTQTSQNPKTMSTKKKIAIVLTSAHQMKDHPTGYWLEELAAPYGVFTSAGYDVDLLSINGGAPPLDKVSVQKENLSEDCQSFQNDPAAQEKLANTKSVHNISDFTAYKAVFFAGGHGTCVDFPNNPDLSKMIMTIYEHGGVIASVCHGPTAFVGVVNEDSIPFVQGKQMCCFSDEEEGMVKLKEKVPFLVETKMKELGARVETGKAWESKTMVDGRLVTGQNPASSKETAELVVKTLSGLE